MLLYVAFIVYNDDYTPLTFAITLLGLVSSVTLLYVVFYIILIPFSFTKKIILYLAGMIFVVANIALVVDFFIYRLFNFHINAMVLNILTSPDAMDSIQVGIVPLITFILLIIGFIGFEIYLLKRLNNTAPKEKECLNTKWNKRVVLPLILVVLSEKFGYGFADLFSKYEIVSKFEVIPLYQPLTFTHIAAKYFGFKPEKQAKYSIKIKAALNYPLEPLKINHEVKKFNIFIIASDSVKYSILNDKIAPNLAKFKQEALSFDHHYSGGNATRFGIFSLIYGLNATYWFSFLNAHQRPVLFDVLKQLGYHIDIISSTNTNWPEFRKTCYVDIQSSIHDKFEGKPWEKDAQSTHCFMQRVEEDAKENKPIFSFTFLDAPHGYSYPPKSNQYGADGGEVNYLSITKESDALKNLIKCYKNAVHYDDMLFGKMIAKLKEQGLYENALVIYTADHGQEFFEYGHFGHNSSFSKAQIHVPLMIKLPQFLQEKGFANRINTSMTSHQDIVPTLLSLLGVSNDPSVYSNGKNFFAKGFKRDYVFSANWNSNAIVTPKYSYLFSNLPNKIFNNEVRDRNYQRITGKRIPSKLIVDVMNENKKFLK